jgi:hypothetical protein
MFKRVESARLVMAAPREAVWQAITDPDNFHKWLSGMTTYFGSNALTHLLGRSSQLIHLCLSSSLSLGLCGSCGDRPGRAEENASTETPKKLNQYVEENSKRSGFELRKHAL